jgi:hypothetical protein
MVKGLAVASLQVHAALLGQQAERLRALAVRLQDAQQKEEAVTLAKEMEAQINALFTEIEMLKRKQG